MSEAPVFNHERVMRVERLRVRPRRGADAVVCAIELEDARHLIEQRACMSATPMTIDVSGDLGPWLVLKIHQSGPEPWRSWEIELIRAAARPESWDRVTIGGVAYPPAVAATPTAEPIDPKAAREARRREIDALLREDAAAAPAFAKARLRAVMAALEEAPPNPPSSLRPGGDGRLARDILAELHLYEAHRGGETRPKRDPSRWLPVHVAAAVEAYEASRRMM